MIKYNHMIGDYMLRVKIDDNIYVLPMSELYEEKFAQFINDGIIDFTSLRGEELYSNINNLFRWVANSMCMFDEDDGYPNDLYDEKKEIRKRMNSVDRLQNHFAELKEFDKSISIIKKFLVLMLEHYGKLMNIDAQERVF